MRGETVARHYAEILFELGERHGEHEALAVAFAGWIRVLEETPRLRVFFDTPKVDLRTKKDILRRILGPRVPPLLLHFLLVVLDRRRQRLYADIERHYRSLVEQKLGELHVHVTVAAEPDEAMEGEIAGILTDRLGRTVIPHIRVDPGIVGGIIVRYGDRVMDGSVRRRLIALRRRMLEVELARSA